jgi:hypothetical protein
VGGVFAQTVTWGGQFEGGVGALNRGDADNVVFGTVAPQAWVDGVRTQLTVDYANAAGNAGFFGRLRASGAGDSGPFFHGGWGWVKLFDNVVELRGGRIHDTFFGSHCFIGNYFLNGTGLVAYVNPNDNVRFGAGGFTGNTLTNGAEWEGGGLNLWGGVHFSLPGTLNLRAQLQFSDAVTNGQVSLNVTALDGIPITYVMRAMNLNNFNDTGILNNHVYVGLNLVDNLSVTLGCVYS